MAAGRRSNFRQSAGQPNIRSAATLRRWAPIPSLSSGDEWIGGFEQFWNESFDRLDAYVQDLKRTKRKE